MINVHEFFFFFTLIQPSIAFPKLTGNDPLGLRAKLAHIWPRDNSSNNLHDLATNPNGSTFLWLPQDEYSGDTFFECVFRLARNKHFLTFVCSGFTFFPFPDPTQCVSPLFV
jgi:hypothetical protein